MEENDVDNGLFTGKDNMTESAPLSTTGKIFFAAVAAYLAGKIGSGSFLKMRGKPDEIRVMAEVVAASKAFQDELKRPGATIDSVIDKMNLKKMSLDRFRRLTGKNWPI